MTTHRRTQWHSFTLALMILETVSDFDPCCLLVDCCPATVLVVLEKKSSSFQDDTHDFLGDIFLLGHLGCKYLSWQLLMRAAR